MPLVQCNHTEICDHESCRFQDVREDCVMEDVGCGHMNCHVSILEVSPLADDDPNIMFIRERK